jgi:hypothetical protein
LQEILLAKQIALSILHIKASRKEKRKGYSDAQIVAALNEVGSSFEGWETIKHHRLNEFRYARDRGAVAEHQLFVRAAEKLMQNEDIRISFSEMERRHGHKLPPLLHQSTSKVFQGQALETSANALHGAWQFFYLSPFDREKRNRPQFRGFGVFIPQPNPSARTADFFVLSGHSRWEGDAFVNQSHVYMMCSDVERTEGAFFLTSKPNENEPFLAGLGTALEREIDRPIRPALGFACFGQKWTPQSTQDNSAKTLDKIILRALNREQIAPHEVEALRRQFCQAYSMTQLRRSFRELAEYIAKLRLNKKPDITQRWLYLEWPS